jgi:phenylalanyl-tRNA synthetase alpha chain
MKADLQKIKTEGLNQIKSAGTAAELEQIQAEILGRKSELTNVLRGLKDLKEEVRGEMGKLANQTRQELEQELSIKLLKLKQDEFAKLTKSDRLDASIPGSSPKAGNLHPITRERFIVEEIFQNMGFEVHEPFMIDDDYHTFTSLNIPEGHPARDMWDTIRLKDNNVLITHTSSMQNRIISSSEPPIRAIVPGKCFRNEATDATHEHSFNQVEGIYVDKGIKLSDMLGTLSEFLRQYFGREMKIKVQPTYFPFVEPGMEIMIDYFGRWLEVIPCGMIHPYVIKEAGLDPEIYSGFAWGAGLDRLAMIKYEIDDIRLLHSGRIDFISQFN